MADVTSTWDKIQQGLKEAERLLSQKQHNLAMVKARQTLEYMVKSLGERACIVNGDISDIIDQLYEGRWITKTTKEHYHKLRIIGNKAVHEGNDSASDANLACQILFEEVHAFTNEYSRQRKPAGHSSSRPRNSSSRQRSSSAPRRRRSKKRKSPIEDFLRILVPVICVILLILIIRILIPETEKDPDTTTAPTDTSASQESVTMPSSIPLDETPAESSTDMDYTQPTETTPAAVVYQTAATLNVRAEPSTTARILAQLEPGVQVTVTGTYDEQWSIILYDGQNAYVATAYLTR